MVLEFTEKTKTGSPLVAEIRIIFDGGMLDGMALEGFAVWKHGDEYSVTFPSRAYKVGGQTKYLWLLTSANDDTSPTYRLRQQIESAYRQWLKCSHDNSRVRSGIWPCAECQSKQV